MKFVIVLLWATGLSVCPFGALTATTINVPGDQPTIQAGINAASNGDTVLVAPGTYNENINFAGKQITITSISGPENTTIQASNTGSPTVSFGTIGFSELSGFTITGSNASGIACNNSSPRIINNIITGNSSNATNLGGGINLNNTTNSMIINNIIHGNAASSFGIAIAMNGSSTNDTIAYNVIYGGLGGTHEIRILASISGSIIHNNTISVSDGDGILYQVGMGELNIRNNIILFSNQVAIRTTNSPIIAEYNCTYSNNLDYNFTPSIGNIYQDALFIDSANNDYSLQINSPCVDAGDPDPQYYDPDITRNDIGAIYYDQSTPYSGPVWYVSLLGSDITGNGSQEYPFATIQKGIDMANVADTVLVFSGTYSGYGNRDLNSGGKNIVIVSESGPELTIIDCDFMQSPTNESKGFYFVNGEDSTSKVVGFTITDGGYDKLSELDGGGAICIINSSPIVENCIFSNNVVSSGAKDGNINVRGYSFCGGGVHCENSSSIFRNCYFLNNYARIDGSGLHCSNSTIGLDQCTFENNIGTYGSGGGLCGDLNSIISISNCVFNSNQDGDGGGIAIFNSTAIIANCSFYANWILDFGTLGGGAILCQDGNLEINDCSFLKNTSGLPGGAIYLTNAIAEITGCTFYDNNGPHDEISENLGIIYSSNSQLDLDNTILAFNRGTFPIYCKDSIPILNCCDIFGNQQGN